jgi:hypothetical protein
MKKSFFGIQVCFERSFEFGMNIISTKNVDLMNKKKNSKTICLKFLGDERVTCGMVKC